MLWDDPSLDIQDESEVLVLPRRYFTALNTVTKRPGLKWKVIKKWFKSRNGKQ